MAGQAKPTKASTAAKKDRKPRRAAGAKKAAQPKRKMGRPSIFSDELAREICDRVMSGITIRKIVADPKMPEMWTIFRWLNEKPDFSEQYARAREAQADHFVDEMQEIADSSGFDVSIDPETGKWKVDGEVVNRARLRVETRARLAELMAPRKYGKKHLEVSGEIHHYHHMPHAELLEKVEAQMRDLGLVLQHEPADG